MIPIGKNVGFYLLELAFMPVRGFFKRGKILPNLLRAGSVVTVNNYNFFTIVVFIAKVVAPWIPWWLLPASERGKGIAHFSTVRGRGIMPACVGTIALVNAEIVAAASRADKFAVL